MLDHVALEVADLGRAALFYDALMHALGGRRVVDSPRAIAYGRDHPALWIVAARATPPRRFASEPGRAGRTAPSGPRRAAAAHRAPGPQAAHRDRSADPHSEPSSAGTAAGAGHLALAAAGRRAVDAAHAAGLAAGGRDAGAPANRNFGSPGCYSGYLVDPDGARVELISGSR